MEKELNDLKKDLAKKEIVIEHSSRLLNELAREHLKLRDKISADGIYEKHCPFLNKSCIGLECEFYNIKIPACSISLIAQNLFGLQKVLEKTHGTK